MLQDMILPPEQLPTEGVSSPFAAQILDFCDDGDIFSETLRNSEVSSCSGGGGAAGSGGGGICCYDDVSLPSDFSPFSSMDPSALSALLDSQPPPEPEPDIILSGNYPSMQPAAPPPASAFPPSSYLSNTQDHFDAAALSDINAINGYSSYSSDTLLPLSAVPPPLAPPSAPPSLPAVFDDDCMLSLSSYMGLDSPVSTSCSFMAPATGGGFFAGCMGVPVSGEGLGFHPGSMVLGPEPVMAAQEVVADYPGESGGGGMGIYGAEGMAQQRMYGSPGDLQMFGDNQHLVNGCGSPKPLASDVASLDESTFKVGRLSVEERKEKIHRYMKKRNERNFSKKIKYACRKTLADSRPRVRGRFAKNDEFGEATKPNSNHHDDEDEEEVVIKEEEDMIDTSELYAHLSGMSSFKCNYTLESWI